MTQSKLGDWRPLSTDMPAAIVDAFVELLVIDSRLAIERDVLQRTRSKNCTQHYDLVVQLVAAAG